MTEFIRVRSRISGHEFDIPIVTFDRHPDRYKVIDKKPVAKQRPASHFSGVVEASKPKRASKSGEEIIAPSVGPTEEEK